MKICLPRATPRLVAIAGPSGTGKSWLASQLQMRLGKEAALLRLDDFYRDLSHLPEGQRQRVNFDHPRSIDWPLFEKTLTGCLAGQRIQAPRYDFNRHTRQERMAWWRPKPLVLVEGLWVLRRPAVRRLFALRIYIDCPRRLQLQRRLRRDALERGRSAESVRRQFQNQVVPMAERHVVPQARWADVHLTSPVPKRTLEALAAQIRELLTPSTV
jgi:uridine kinase